MGEYKGTAATVWHLSPLPQWLRALAPFAPSCPAAPNRTALFLAMLSFCLSKALKAERSLPGTCPAASAAGAEAALRVLASCAFCRRFLVSSAGLPFFIKLWPAGVLAMAFCVSHVSHRSNPVSVGLAPHRQLHWRKRNLKMHLLLASKEM